VTDEKALLHDLAVIFFDPEVTAALHYYHDRAKQRQPNCIIANIVKKREEVRKAYIQYISHQEAKKKEHPP
jgi:hypothetical protein